MNETDAAPWIHVNTIQQTMDHEDANLYLRKGWILLGRTMTHDYILGWIKGHDPEYPEQSIHVRARQYAAVIQSIGHHSHPFNTAKPASRNIATN